MLLQGWLWWQLPRGGIPREGLCRGILPRLRGCRGQLARCSALEVDGEH